MSTSAKVNVGGEECTLVTIAELCESYKQQSSPAWMSDEPAAKRAKSDSREHSSQDENDKCVSAKAGLRQTTTTDATDTPDVYVEFERRIEETRDVIAAGDAILAAADAALEHSRKITDLFFQDGNGPAVEPVHTSDGTEGNDKTEEVAVATEHKAVIDLACKEKMVDELPFKPHQERQLNIFVMNEDSKYTAEMYDDNVEAVVNSISYANKWKPHEHASVYPAADPRYGRVRRYRPLCGELPRTDIVPILNIMLTSDIVFWNQSPWIRQIGAHLMWDQDVKQSETVLLYNVYNSKTALTLMTKAMKSSHCRDLQMYMRNKTPYILEFDDSYSDDYDAEMASKTVGILAYSHFASIANNYKPEEYMISPFSVYGNALPMDSISVFSDVGAESCHDVIQAGIWDLLPYDWVIREMYAMQYRLQYFSTRCDTIGRLWQTVNMDDDADDGSWLACDLPIDDYGEDHGENPASWQNEEKVGISMQVSGVVVQKWVDLCTEWQSTLVLAFAKNALATKNEAFEDKEMIVMHMTSLMVNWYDNVYGLTGCLPCRLPLSHGYANFHWMCGCRVYDFLAYLVEKYVDTFPDDSELMKDMELEDAFVWIQHIMRSKMEEILSIKIN